MRLKSLLRLETLKRTWFLVILSIGVINLSCVCGQLGSPVYEAIAVGETNDLVVDPAGTDPRTRPVIPNTRYHFKIERVDGRTVRWLVDDIEMISFADPKPLVGEIHDHFAFNDWEVQVCFDRLAITPLGSSEVRGTR